MVSKRIKSLRAERKITQKELADAIDISSSTIAMIESGKREGNRETLTKIATYFGVSIDYLYGIEEKKPFIKKSRVSIIESFIDDLIEDGIITNPNDIDKETEQMILNAVKAQIALKMKKNK